MTSYSNPKYPFWPLFIRILVYGMIMVFISQILMWDAAAPAEVKFSENSYTEWSQQAVLIIMTLLFMAAARQYPAWRSMSILLAGCSAIGLVREYNNFFNVQVFDGAWQLLSVIALIITLVFFYPNRKGLWLNLKAFRGSFSEGVLVMGFITTFVFSRLFGRTTFWETLMEERYFRSVKNAAEEGIELLGYALLLIASIEYLMYIRKQTLPPPHERP